MRLGLSVNEFLNLESVEINAMIDEYNKKLKEDLQVKRLLATHIVNSSGKLKKAAKPEDLFLLPSDKKKNRTGLTKDQLKKLSSGKKRA